MLRYAFTIFLSAFLLFEVQPIIGRKVLPWFGGIPSVWSTCMLFFQAMLLGGYLYAHLLSKFRPKTQAVVHLCLLAVSLLFANIMPADKWRPTSSDSPVRDILTLLTVAVGIPYFILSSTGPLIQSWFAKTNPGTSPYRLYALSNLGSLLALMTYPVFVEPTLTLPTQTLWWGIGYASFVLFCSWCAFVLMQKAPDEDPVVVRAESERDRPPFGHYVLWVILAAMGTFVLLAGTNQMCQDIAVVPFLYIAPLALYLLSLIICFDNPNWYSRVFWMSFLVLVMVLTADVYKQGVSAGIIWQIIGYTAFVFAACMVCHGELVRLRPAPAHLTGFYLLVSTGGMIGGLLVSVDAPRMFNDYYEFPIAFLAVPVLAIVTMLTLRPKSVAWWEMFGFTATAFVLLWAFRHESIALLLVMATLAIFHLARLPDNGARSDFIAFAAAVMCLLWTWEPVYDKAKGSKDAYIFQKRNFFGVLKIQEEDRGLEETRTLSNGRITHGMQYIAPDRRLWQTTYYGPKSGVGTAINHHPRNAVKRPRGLRIAAIGLGAGTLAAYGEKGDMIRFYDINPMVEKISNEYFYFRKASLAGDGVDVVLGDARVSLERQLAAGEKQDFDVIAVDAFSSDSIPVHLITKEATEVYLKHLRDPNEGIIAFHISNRYLELGPVCRGIAKALDMEARKIENESDNSHGVYNSSWVLVSRNKKFFEDPEVKALIGDPAKEWTKPNPDTWEIGEELPRPDFVWTDDFSSMLPIVQMKAVRYDWLDFKHSVERKISAVRLGLGMKTVDWEKFEASTEANVNWLRQKVGKEPITFAPDEDLKTESDPIEHSKSKTKSDDID
ncbi:MAG TPA: ferrichrome ABC transporter permease [Planctomycetia bacterium]|nr:ferrichrome ABC transporter permease [Planctomycetia bacterium]